MNETTPASSFGEWNCDTFDEGTGHRTYRRATFDQLPPIGDFCTVTITRLGCAPAQAVGDGD